MAKADVSAARLLLVGFAGRELSDPLRRLLDAGVGGVILFARNVASPEQVARLTEAIKRRAARPLTIGVDQEGGLVQRLKAGFTRVPAMRLLGQSGDCGLAFEVGRVMGRELRAVGIDLNFAPVLDVDTNPDNPVIGQRALSSEPTVVAELGVALGKGLESEGVASCAKHFPGHGDTRQDSHLELPHLPHSRRRLEEVELVPFRAWVRAGLASMMTAHIVFDALDPHWPATMSPPLLETLLRQELGYDGLVISDDLEMKAVTTHFGCEEAAVRAVAAGVDQLLVCHHEAVAHRVIAALEAARAAERLPEERVREALARVAALAARFAAPPGGAQLERLAGADARAVMQRFSAPQTEKLAGDPTERPLAFRSPT